MRFAAGGGAPLLCCTRLPIKKPLAVRGGAEEKVNARLLLGGQRLFDPAVELLLVRFDPAVNVTLHVRF